jgi:hypothetical protein
VLKALAAKPGHVPRRDRLPGELYTIMRRVQAGAATLA